MPALGPPVSQRTATRRRRQEYEQRQRTLNRPTPTPVRRAPRSTPQLSAALRVQQQARRDRQLQTAQKAVRRPAPGLQVTRDFISEGGPARPTRPPPSATKLALAQERVYKSQGKAIETHATTDPALREIERYAVKAPAAKRVQLTQIRAKPQSQRSLGEYHILKIHAGRARSDVKMVKRVGFLPRVRYHTTPKVTKYNVMPVKGDKVTAAAQMAPPALRASLAVSPKARKQFAADVNAKGITAAIESLRTTKARKEAIVMAPAVKAIEQTLRPVHGIAGGVHYGLKGKNIATGVKRGVTLKDRVLFSDVLGDLGMPKGALRSILGTTLDIGLDPTTYAGFGVGSIAVKGARKVAEEAAGRAYVQALKQSGTRVAANEITKREAKELARRSSRSVYKTAFEKHLKGAKPEHLTRGLDVRIAGGKTARRVGRAVKRRTGIGTKGVLAPTTRFTAAQGRAGQKLLKPITESARFKAARAGGRERLGGTIGPARMGRQRLNPKTGEMEYAGPAPKAEHLLTKALQRESRAESESEIRFFNARARSLLNRTTPKEEQAVVDVLEKRGGRGVYTAAERRGSAKGIRDSARLPLRNILTSGQKRILPNLNPAELRRRLKSSRDPERVVKIVNQIESDLKYAERIGTRSGALSSRIGAKRLTDPELALKTTAQRVPRATAALEHESNQASLEARSARQRVEAQRAQLEAATTKGQKRHRQTKLAALENDYNAVQERSRALNQRLRGARKQQVAGQKAARELRTSRRERFGGVQVPEVTADLGPVQERLARARARAAPNGGVRAYHGTRPENVEPIKLQGFRPTRGGQVFFAGERKNVKSYGEGLVQATIHARRPLITDDIQSTWRKLYGESLAQAVKRERVPEADLFRAKGFDAVISGKKGRQTIQVLDPKVIRGPREVEAAKAKVGSATRRLAQVTRQRERQTAAREAALRRQEAIGPPEAAGYFPRVRSEKGMALDQMAAELGPTLEGGPPKEAQGVRRPTGGPLTQRRDRATRAYYREHDPRKLRKTETGLVPTMAIYGHALSGRVAHANLNRKLFAEAGEKLPDNITTEALHDLEDRGFNVYHLERGGLQPLHADRDLKEIQLASQPAIVRGEQRATAHGGQYAVLPNQLVRDVYSHGRGPSQDVLSADVRRATGAWKGFALKTPSYLVRNFFGDLYNAWGHEGAIRALASTAQGQHALLSMARHEKALRTFERQIPKPKRSIILSKNQRDEISVALGYDVGERISAKQAALLAERSGAIRQGRFSEVAEARQAKGPKARRQGGWESTSRHVEDSIRMGTFLGGLHHGLTPREAAQRVANIHFDYGDLSNVEKNVLRQFFPFYTFTARNVPLQTKMLFTRPSRAATIGKTREESKRYAGVQESAEKGLDPYEALQLGMFYKTGKGKGTRKGTISMGSPFVDLSVPGAILDSVASGKVDPIVNEAFRRGGGLLHPIKVLGELPAGYSLFYKDHIRRAGQGPRELAPDWAVLAAKTVPGFRKLTGISDDFVDKQTGNRGSGWSRKWGYFFRAATPGPAGVITRAPGLSVPSKNARGMTPLEVGLTNIGIRSKQYTARGAELSAKFNEQKRLNDQMADLRDRAHPTDRQANGQPYKIGKEHPTPEYEKLAARQSVVSSRIKTLQSGQQAWVSGRPVSESGGGGRGGLDLSGGLDLGGGLKLEDLDLSGI